MGPEPHDAPALRPSRDDEPDALPWPRWGDRVVSEEDTEHRGAPTSSLDVPGWARRAAAQPPGRAPRVAAQAPAGVATPDDSGAPGAVPPHADSDAAADAGEDPAVAGGTPAAADAGEDPAVAGGTPAAADAGEDPAVAGGTPAAEVGGDAAHEGRSPPATARAPDQPDATPAPGVPGGLPLGRTAGVAAETRPDGGGASEHRPATVLAVGNQKGGVGKTTTAVSLAAAIAETGAHVLLVDLDPQGNASSGLGMRPREAQPTIYDVLVDDLDLLDAVRPATVRNLFVVPANIDLAGAEIELVSAFSREQRLRRALDTVRDDYDLIVIDCPPSLGLLTVNALTAADGLLVPIQCEFYALEGLGALRHNADLVRTNLNRDLSIVGFVLTMLDGRTRLSQQVVEEVRNHFGDKVFRTRIPRSVRLAEAPGFGEPITVFDPGSRGAMAYRRLARELLERLEAAHLPPSLVQEGASI